jgi:hypothetical protein
MQFVRTGTASHMPRNTVFIQQTVHLYDVFTNATYKHGAAMINQIN